MMPQVTRKVAGEQERGGLIIVNGWYGNLSKYGVDEPSPYVIDVTVPLQNLVEDSQLHLHETSKSKLMGFYDPCIGEEKALLVRYLFRDQLHEVVVGDTDTLAAPMKSHILN